MSSTNGSRRSRIASAAAAVLAFSGVGLVGLSLASQRSAPQPPPMGRPSEVNDLRTDTPATEKPERSMLRSKPVRLDIPSIDVHSKVRYLGMTPDGGLEVPAPGPHYDEVGWYRYSPTPGSIGPSILLGHVDSRTGPSVFFRLGKLEPGDRVSVARADDSIAVFVVDEVHSYAKDDFPTKLVYGNIDEAGLRLITCGGAFDDASGHYLDNIVVFASLADLEGR